MANNFKNIDELFRSRFENFEPEPPQHIWQKIFRKINQGASGGAGFGKIILISGVVIVTLSTILFFTLNPFSNSANISETPSVNLSDDNLLAQVTTIPDKEIVEQEITIEESILNQPKDVKPVNQQTEFGNKNIISKISRKTSERIALTDNYVPAKVLMVHSEPVEIPDIFEDVLQLEIKPVRIQSLKAKQHVYLLSGRSPLDHTKFAGDEGSAKTKLEHYFKLGAFINPEVVFYPDDSVTNSRNFNFGIDFRYYTSKSFFIRSGLGISIARDEGKYQVDYNEYIGSYEDVYDVTFETSQSGIVPIYHTKTVEVYDSIEHVSISQSKNTYIYLQLPVLAGYEVQKRNLTYTFMAGPCVSFLINKNIPDPELPDNIKIVSIDDRIADRIDMNWQMVVGMGINYKVDRKFEVALEPTFRYYLNSAYEGNIITSKHPLVFGLRAGLLFKL